MNNKTSALAGQVLIQTGSLLLAAALSAQAESLDETTVLATAYPTEKKSIGLRVNVEDATNLRDAGIWSLNDAALTSPGVNIFSSGANGTAASLFTRGTESERPRSPAAYYGRQSGGCPGECISPTAVPG